MMKIFKIDEMANNSINENKILNKLYKDYINKEENNLIDAILAENYPKTKITKLDIEYFIDTFMVTDSISDKMVEYTEYRFSDIFKDVSKDSDYYDDIILAKDVLITNYCTSAYNQPAFLSNYYEWIYDESKSPIILDGTNMNFDVATFLDPFDFLYYSRQNNLTNYIKSILLK